MIQEDDFDKKIFKYFEENTKVPNEIKNAIFDVELKNNKKIISSNNIRKIVATIISAITISTGVVFAKDITEIAKKVFFDSKEGTDVAIENGYIYESEKENNLVNEEENNLYEKEIIESANAKTKIINMIMDDYTLDLKLSVELDKSIDLKGIEKTDFPNMIITDNMNNILYCVNNEVIQNYCDRNGLKSDYDSIKEKYINTTSNVFVNDVMGNSVIIEINLTAGGNTFPRSEKIYIDFDAIEIEKNGVKSVISGNWNNSFTVPEPFIKRETAIYKAIDCNNDKVDKSSIKMEVYETGTRIDMSMYWGDYEEWSSKTDEIRKENVLASQIIKFEKSYIENEKGEKFYSSKSSYAGNGLTLDGRLRVWNTFNLTKYNMTKKLKVVLLTIEEEEIVIELER